MLGHVHLQGCLTGLAFVLPTTSAAEAVQLLKVNTTGFCMITSLPSLWPLHGHLSAEGLPLGSATASSGHPLLYSILVYSFCCGLLQYRMQRTEYKMAASACRFVARKLPGMQDDLVSSLKARIEGLAADAEEGATSAMTATLPAKQGDSMKLLRRIAIPVQVPVPPALRLS